MTSQAWYNKGLPTAKSHSFSSRFFLENLSGSFYRPVDVISSSYVFISSFFPSLISHRIISFRDFPFTCDVGLKAFNRLSLPTFFVNCWSEWYLQKYSKHESVTLTSEAQAAKLQAGFRQLNRVPRIRRDSFGSSRHNITIPFRAGGCLSLWLNQDFPHRKISRKRLKYAEQVRRIHKNFRPTILILEIIRAMTRVVPMDVAKREKGRLASSFEILFQQSSLKYNFLLWSIQKNFFPGNVSIKQSFLDASILSYPEHCIFNKAAKRVRYMENASA